jgi:hypothetical protein
MYDINISIFNLLFMVVLIGLMEFIKPVISAKIKENVIPHLANLLELANKKGSLIISENIIPSLSYLLELANQKRGLIIS